MLIMKLKNVFSARLLKTVFKCVSDPISYLINESFCLGVFPEDLKIATIIPIHKKGDCTDLSNYRPYHSLLSKLFEKAMANRMTKYLKKFNIMSPYQFGFQKGKSTCDAVCSLTEYIYDSLNARKHAVSLLIDLSKAYDTVSHPILLSKLFRYGFRGVVLGWFESYLKNIHHRVRVGDKISSSAVGNISIPQGSVLGCVLFSLYNNDLPSISNVLKPVLFADDTVFIHSDSNFNCLISNFNNELTKINLWLVRNKLTLSIDKTVSLIFSNRKQAIDSNNKLRIANSHVNFEPSTK